MIPSAYNFVPLSEHVFFPDGGIPQIDVPYRDGLSGWIDLVLEATTPIYTRDTDVIDDLDDLKAGLADAVKHRVRQDLRLDKPNKHQINQWLAANIPNSYALLNLVNREHRELWHKHAAFHSLPDGRKALPGTTVRNAIRNVLSIITHAKFQPESRRLSIRDLNAPELYGSWMTHKITTASGDFGFEPNAQAGWLVQDSKKRWWIRPCRYARIEQQELELYTRNAVDLGTSQLAQKKYAQWEKAHARGEESLHQGFKIDEPIVHTNHSQPIFYSKAAIRSDGDTQGSLVFTGQPADRPETQDSRQRKRNESKGKHMEFVFYGPNLPDLDDWHFNEIVPQHGRLSDQAEHASPFHGWIPVREDVRVDFELIHEENKDWIQRWKDKLKHEGAVPVFFLSFEDGIPEPGKCVVPLEKPEQLFAVGLSQMFRLAYRHKTENLVPPDHSNDDLDLPEMIFGTSRGEGLRGRVNAEPFVAVGKPTELDPVFAVLGSPKASFYPNYIEQETDGTDARLAPRAGYKSFHDAYPEAMLRGWKRYPVRPDMEPGQSFERPPWPPGGNFKTSTCFRPLAAGTRFEGRIHFHNLRPWELGALLWAIRFGVEGDLDQPPYRHSIGMAKSLGYGAVKVGACEVHAVDAHRTPVCGETGDWMGSFADEINRWLTSVGQPKLTETPAVSELLLMANSGHGRLANLHAPDDVRGFRDFKTWKEVLPRFSRVPKDHESTR